MRSLRNILVALFLMPVAFSEAAPYPQLLRLQGRFTDTKIPLTDTLPVRFSIWDTEDGYGNLLWEEVQTVSVQNNTFQVILGRSKPLTPSVFSGGDRWVELQVGNDAPLRPRHWIPNKYIQEQVAAAQAAPVPVVTPPPPVPVTPAPAATPMMSDQERKDLELEIEKYIETSDESAPAPVRPHKHKHTVQPAEDTGQQGPVYEVQPGDTLKSIAQKLYGNAELWYDLYYLNRDRLGPMGYLFTGQILVLPTQTPGVSTK
jgi:LysM repeat protein